MMKRTIPCLFLLLLLLGFTACDGFFFDGAPQWMSREGAVTEGVRRTEDGAVLLLSSESASLLRGLWEKGRWVDLDPSCDKEYVFILDGAEVQYHASCGTFYRFDTGMTLVLKEAQRIEVNRVLGLSQD